jgi:methylase of polypeptide subunit release factors
MINYKNQQNIDEILMDETWNFGVEKYSKMHDVHAYPAKFPAMIAKSAFIYAKQEGVDVKKVADIFCGCGTVALEAKLQGIQFWGCDINPVATLIARAKSNTYKTASIESYYAAIISDYNKLRHRTTAYNTAPDRMQYWFNRDNFLELDRIKRAIENIVPAKSEYRTAFYCIFSSTLKPCSKWLTKSIKPQVDPNKVYAPVIDVFNHQYARFKAAVEELPTIENINVDIHRVNFLKTNRVRDVDLIVTSPPYVTSYEYADLHQLTSLWLDYTDDYRKLRKGTIGSAYDSQVIDVHDERLSECGLAIINALQGVGNANAKTKAVVRYFLDMQSAVQKSYEILNENGMVFFVIGDTEYRGVRIENSAHLMDTMQTTGFMDIKVGKRTISRKTLTPYRDAKGKFSTDGSGKLIYHEEFVISGRKMQ